MLRPRASSAHATPTPAPMANAPLPRAKSVRPRQDYHPPPQLARRIPPPHPARRIPPPRTPPQFPPAQRQQRALRNRNSNFPRASSFVRPHNHPVAANNLAASRMSFPINHHAAFKTNSHSAKRRAPLSTTSPAKSPNASRHNRRGNARAGAPNPFPAVHKHLHTFS